MGVFLGQDITEKVGAVVEEELILLPLMQYMECYLDQQLLKFLVLAKHFPTNSGVKVREISSSVVRDIAKGMLHRSSLVKN